MKSEAKKKSFKYIPKQKLTKTQLNNVRKEIQTICKEIGWIQFSSFEELADILPEGTGALCPPHEEIEALLAKGGAPTSPKDIGISKELFHNSLLKGYTVRPRYSIMQFAKDNGRLEEIADNLATKPNKELLLFMLINMFC